MYRFVKSLLIGIPVGITFFDYVGYVARVEGVSMQPSLNPDNVTDYVFLSRWNIENYEITKGEIISCLSPKNRRQKIIKRVVGLEGDYVTTERYSKQFKVPEGHCWIEGDNFKSSLDSHVFGAIPMGLIVAKAKFIVWPPSRWQAL